MKWRGLARFRDSDAQLQTGRGGISWIPKAVFGKQYIWHEREYRMQHIGVFSSSFEVLQASPFTSQQLWLSRQEEALNPHTLYSSYAHDPTSPPPARCLTLFSATRLEKARRRASERHTLLLPLLFLPPVLDVKPSRKLLNNFICQLHSNNFLPRRPCH